MDKLRVLLADEHRIYLAGLRRLLEDEFDVVGTAQDGLVLGSAAAELKPDVIVTEFPLPFLHGPEAIWRLKCGCKSAKIVILSSRQDSGVARESLNSGGSAYILTYDEPAELISAIRAVAGGESGIVSPTLEEPAHRGEKSRGSLTPRQRDVLRLMAEGRTQKEIASILNLSVRTVQFHKYELIRRLAVRNSAELMALAALRGIIDLNGRSAHYRVEVEAPT